MGMGNSGDRGWVRRMTTTSNPEPVRGGRFRWWWAAAALLSVGLLVGAAVWWTMRPAPAPPAVSLEGLDTGVAQSIAQAQALLQKSPRSGDAWGRLGMVLAAHAFRPQAVYCFAEAQRLQPREPRWPYFRGVMLESDGAEADAIPALRRAVEFCPAEPDAVRLRLADLLVKQGDLDGAEQNYLELLARDAGQAAAHLGLARIAVTRGDSDEGARELAHCLVNPSVRRAAYLLLAEVQQRLGDPMAAQAATRQAAALPPDAPWPDPFMAELAAMKADTQTLIRQAQSLQNSGRNADAQTAMEEAEGNHPATPQLLEGRRRLAAGDVQGAEQSLRQAVSAEPTLAQTHFWLGMALLAKHDAAGATASFRQAVALQPLHAAAYQGLSQALEMQGDRQGAVDALRLAVRYQPQRAEMQRQLGELLARDGRDAEALVHLRQALDLNPEDRATKSLIEQIGKHVSSPAQP